MRLASLSGVVSGVVAPLAGVLFVVCSLTGCRFGEARFTTSFDDTAFDPGGTVFAYLDERDADLVEDQDPRVVVAMTWIVFDPQSDLNDLDGAALSAMAHEMAVRDALVLVFDRQGDVDAGEEFGGTRDGYGKSGVVVDDVEDDAPTGLEARLHLAPERLSAGSTFQGLKPFASRQISEVEIDLASFSESSPVVAGTFRATIEAVAGRDIGDAREGTIEGTFRAPLVDERVAESNLALLDDDGLLGLPLPARAP